MSLLLHPKTAAQLAAAARTPTGSLIFQGPRGLGKATAARELATRLNCQNPAPDGAPQPCAACRAIAAGNFADFIRVDSGGKASLGIESVRHLMSGLGLRPYAAGATRVVVIDDADRLTVEAQNALLKLLEEPPPATLIILIAEQIQSLLITVRSRCQAVRFLRPGEADLAAYLVSTQGIPGPQAAQLAAAAAGSPGTALGLAANPGEAEAITALTASAGSVQSGSLFQRLILSSKLATAATDLDQLGEALHRRIVAQAQAAEITPQAAAVWLNALEQFRLQLKAKVAPRVALERLMVETA